MLKTTEAGAFGKIQLRKVSCPCCKFASFCVYYLRFFSYVYKLLKIYPIFRKFIDTYIYLVYHCTQLIRQRCLD